jgi:hypothetical protein
MPGSPVTLAAPIVCAHGGQVAATPNPRVTVLGQPTVFLTVPFQIVGCAMPPPPSGNGPCLTAPTVLPSARVQSNGQPLALVAVPPLCVPTGTPLTLTVGARVIMT